MPSSSTNPFDDDDDDDDVDDVINNNNKTKSNNVEQDYYSYNKLMEDEPVAVRNNRTSTSSASRSQASAAVVGKTRASTSSSTRRNPTTTIQTTTATSMKSTNPFDDYENAIASSTKYDNGNEGEPIFACRTIDWPIPTVLSYSTYQKLYNLSLKKGGMEEDYYSTEPATTTTTTTSYVSGLLKTLLVPSTAADTTSTIGNNNITDYPQQQHYFVRSPHCVASSNGWIVAVMEVSTTNNTTSGPAKTSSSSASSYSSSSANHTTIDKNKQKTLQIISRWNVRRSTMLQQSPEELLLPLPSSSGSIQHVFIDPTGHHVLLSSVNGSLFHLHSSYHHQPKLIFSSTFVITAVAWDKVSGTELSTKNILLGTNHGCIYECCITVATTTATTTTKKPSTDSSFSTALTTTNTTTDIMDATLISTTTTSSTANTKENPNTSRENPNLDRTNNNNSPPGVVVPTCLVDLNSLDLVHKDRSITTSTTAVGAVTGIHVERLSAGRVLILMVTSGIPHPTRFYTFCSSYDSSSTSATSASSASSTFHSAFYGPPITATSTAPSANTTNPSSGINVKKSVHKTKSMMANMNHYKHSMELPGTIDFASLKVCQNTFALYFGSGIYYGSFHTTTITSTNQPIIYDTGILPTTPPNTVKGIITSIALTPYHILTISTDGTISFWNRISQNIIQQEPTNTMIVSANNIMEQHPSTSSISLPIINRETSFHGEFLMDPRRDQVWLRQGRSLLHISSINEDRDVWRYALERCLENPGSTKEDFSGDIKEVEESFDQVKGLCSTQVQKTVVTVVRGEYFLYRHRPDLAARYLSQAPSTVCPFTKTTLRLALPSFPEVGITYDIATGENNSLLEDDNNDIALMYQNALQSYLTDKLNYAITSKDSVSCAMLGAWLTELQLHSFHANPNGDESREGLASFLSKFAQNLDAPTTISTLQSHDIHATICAPYAAVSGDVSTAVNAALSGEEGKIGALEALRVLNDAPIEKAEPCYYKNAYVLLCRAPLQSCKCFLSRYSQGLQPTKLLPSLMAYERQRLLEREHRSLAPLHQLKGHVSNTPTRASLAVDDDHAVIKYLEGVINLGCRSVAIYNYLVSLYAALDDEGPLFRFLSALIPTSKGGNCYFPLAGAGSELGCPLDMSFALRKILKTGRHYRSAVKLYMGFGLRHQAVELSLKVDPALARELARESVGKDERKRLWLMIARNAAAEHEHGGEKDSSTAVEKVVSVLKDCGPDVLSIEDVLPFLPDFAQIDQFKDEICEALTAYSSKIDHYLQEMSECDQACSALREEIARLGKHEMQMRADARCAFSKKRVLEANEPFYVFPSGYVILETPLKREVLPYLNDKQQQRVEQIEQEMSLLRLRYNSIKTETHMPGESKLLYERLQAELNGLIAADCPLTGNIMIESIDAGFDVAEDLDFDRERFLKQHSILNQ